MECGDMEPDVEDLPSSDERLDRSQIRIEATWEDASYRATNGDGDLYTSPTLGIASYDLEEDLRDELCARNLAGITYEAHERWSMLDWTPDQLEYTPLDVRGRLTVWNRTSEPNSQIGDYWIEPQQDGGFEKRKWNGMYWEDLTLPKSRSWSASRRTRHGTTPPIPTRRPPWIATLGTTGW